MSQTIYCSQPTRNGHCTNLATVRIQTPGYRATLACPAHRDAQTRWATLPGHDPPTIEPVTQEPAEPTLF